LPREKLHRDGKNPAFGGLYGQYQQIITDLID